MKRRLLVWVFLPVISLMLLSAVASMIAPAESTIAYRYLQPIDIRTKVLILATGLSGPLIGWTAAAAPELSHIRNSEKFAALAAAVLSALTLIMSGPFSMWVIVGISVMSALQAWAMALFIPLSVNGLVDRFVSLAVVIGIGSFGLVAILDRASGFTGVLIPTFWIGEILCAAQLGQETRSGALVGVSLNLLPLTVALGLNQLKHRPSAK